MAPITYRSPNIDVKRGSKIIHSVNLYNFLVQGKLDYIQFADGDVVLVHPIGNTITISGDVNNPFQFEFSDNQLLLEDALKLAHVKSNATPLSVSRKAGGKTVSSYHKFDEIDGLNLYPGDEVVITTDLKPETILVKVTGEQIGPKQLILPYGSRLDDALARVIPNERTQLMWLFREMRHRL